MAAPRIVPHLVNFGSKLLVSSRVANVAKCIIAASFRKAHSVSSSQPSEPNTNEVPSASSELEGMNLCLLNEPIDMDDPYTKPHRKCILCQYGVEPDYKNVQLLSQFVSPFTGRIYGRHITGLCTPMQRRIARLIKRAQKNGFMPYMYKETTFLKDPKLYDPFSRVEEVPEESQ